MHSTYTKYAFGMCSWDLHDSRPSRNPSMVFECDFGNDDKHISVVTHAPVMPTYTKYAFGMCCG